MGEYDPLFRSDLKNQTGKKQHQPAEDREEKEAAQKQERDEEARAERSQRELDETGAKGGLSHGWQPKL
jgi:hypothetical protein